MLSFLSHGDVPHLLHAYGYWAVGATVAIESIGLPLPGETTLIAAAIVAGTSHELDIGLVIAVAAIGAILGDNIGFWIGRELGYRLVLRYGRYVRITEPRIKIGQYLFQRYGGAVVFFGRFVAVLRALAAFLAGANCMGWRRFLVFNATGAIVWAATYGIGAYYLGEGISRLAAPLGIGIGALAVAVLALAAVLVHRHEPELERKAVEALPGPLRPHGTRRSR